MLELQRNFMWQYWFLVYSYTLNESGATQRGLQTSPFECGDFLP